MGSLHLDVLEFVSRTQKHHNLEELVGDFGHLIERHGFSSFILTGLPTRGLDVEPLVLANRWPEGWSNRYREQVYFRDDPVSKWSMKERHPFKWSRARNQSVKSRLTRQIDGEAYDFGLADGIAIPLSDRHGRAVVSVATEGNLQHDIAVEASLYLATAYLWNCAERIVRPDDKPAKLTEREREVLHWYADGKTAWEISRILSISESTVKTHLRLARERLGVVTSTQAVALAFSCGEMQL